MRIGIDGRVFTAPQTGVGKYISGICRHLGDYLPSAEFHVFNRDAVNLPVRGGNWIPHFEENAVFRKLPNFMWQKFISGGKCRKARIDLYWGGNGSLPFHIPDIKKVVTVHDLVHVVCPQTMNPVNMLVLRAFFSRDIASADRIIANSHGTSARLKRYCGRSADAVAYPAVSFGAGEGYLPDIEKVKETLSLPERFLLCIAALEPRKNLELVISTFSDMVESTEMESVKLVLAGSPGWKNRRLVKLLEQEKMKKHILSLGYVSDEELEVLYSLCSALVFPSVYEGFGMPVLEARALGAPVITTDIPELREAGDNECIYVSPDTDSLRRAIGDVLEQPKRAGRMKNLPTWEKSAEIVGRVLLETLEQDRRVTGR